MLKPMKTVIASDAKKRMLLSSPFYLRCCRAAKAREQHVNQHTLEDRRL